MKFLLALASLVTASAVKTVPLNDVKANSKMGNHIMSQARRLEQNNNEEIEFTWVADYALKFQGCHHISQWNEEADGEEDVRIETKRLIRFRLCPADTCTSTNAGGCSGEYGDYIVDMNTYLEAYFQNVEEVNQYRCEYLENMVCACNDDDQNQQGDDFEEEQCLWDCFEENGMESICMDRNPYNDDEQEVDEFELQQYMECANAEFPDNNNNRKLEEEEVEYFVGPYCAEQGGVIYLGMFTDDTCTTFADEYGGKELYKTMSGGYELPYSEASLVGPECVSCKEPEDFNDDGNDQADADEVVEFCEELYRSAGKCEKSLSGAYYPNNNACNYMEGIKIIRKNGTVVSGANKANKTASIFIGIFVVAFVLLAAYVYYLKTKLDRASINLSE